MGEYFFVALLLTAYVAWPVLLFITIELALKHSSGFRRFARWLWRILDM